MREEDVLLKTHSFLKAQGLNGQSIVRLYTDAHHTLLKNQKLQPFQRFTLNMGDFVLHPDLVGQLDDGESIFALEAKGAVGTSELVRGLAQAELYQSGFHYSFLATVVNGLGENLLQFARRKNIGVIAVSEDVKILNFPEAQMPFRKIFQSIARQMETVIQITEQQTFQYNAPTHYMVWSVILEPHIEYEISGISKLLENYPIPEGKNKDGWKATLAGARKLGIVNRSGNLIKLTPIGEAIKDILRTNLDEWIDVHEKAGGKRRKYYLFEYKPQAAACLRLLLLQEPILNLVIEGLKKFPNFSTTFSELAVVCDGLDHARAPIFFLKPEALESLIDSNGHIDWDKTEPRNYRGRMFFQYKRILQHAGVIKPDVLGGSSVKEYEKNISRDIWTLI
ncbi:MAG: hypothetical protein KME13_11755 [Myxacorys californica WJT36-NPBG1]|jgi:hypothetical protein|nr:hypothetical protein [Myxacorys californica WJT36-NPBG1]